MKFVDQFNPSSVDPVRDAPNKRSVYLEGGRQIALERKDPYGFVYVTWDKGAAPVKLQGSFTDFDKARLAVLHYFESETFTAVSDTPTVKVEPPKYKKAFRDPKTGENLLVNG